MKVSEWMLVDGWVTMLVTFCCCGSPSTSLQIAERLWPMSLTLAKSVSSRARPVE